MWWSLSERSMAWRHRGRRPTRVEESAGKQLCCLFPIVAKTIPTEQFRTAGGGLPIPGMRRNDRQGGFFGIDVAEKRLPPEASVEISVAGANAYQDWFVFVAAQIAE